MPVLDIIPPDPALKDLQLAWEAQYWYKSQGTRKITAQCYERFMKYFGPERKPRDIFRIDVAAYRTWLRKKGWSENSIRSEFESGSRLFRFLDELELVEKGWNPFLGMAPRKIVIRK